MITFTFYLLRPEEDTSVIMGALRSDKLRATFSVGLRAETKYWDKKMQCVIKSSPDFAFISEKLAIYKSTILKEIRAGELDNLSLSDIRDHILASMGRTTVSKPTDDLISIYRTWATTSINQHNATRQHLQCFRVMEEYAKYRNKTTFPFEEMIIPFTYNSSNICGKTKGIK